ncbi:MAG TPA: hypothetical protein VGH28_18830 [Polyangiaceae bacterium]|jgi:hypothetical protein
MRKTRLQFLVAALLVSGVAWAQQPQTDESRGMLPPSPFDAQGRPQKLVPPPPPPWNEPLSTSGTDVVSPLPEPRPDVHPMGREHMEHMARMRELERRIDELEHERHESREPTKWVEWLKPSLLLQPQLVWNFFNAAASPNAQSGLLPPGIGSNDVTATPSGNTTNPDFFRLRRARLKLDFVPTEYARFVMEIEPVPRDPTIPGSGTIAREIEAIARVPVSTRTSFEVGAGSFEVPFGAEWREAHGDRPFIERSYFQQNMFPGDFDLGLHASIYATRHLEAELALLNGRTFGELDRGGNLDLNRPKDGTATVRFRFDGLRFGVSGYAGEGQLVDGANLRFKQYDRFAIDGDVSYEKALRRVGTFRAFGELVYGTNMDRGVFDAGNLPTIPADLTQDVTNRDELGALVRVDQELGRHLLIGARYDYYSPDVNLANDGRHTLGAVVAIRPFQPAEWLDMHPSIQLDFEYDHAWDTVRPSGPQGVTKEIDTLSFVLQGRL